MYKQSLLPSGWEVPEIFRDRLGEFPGRQRTMLADGHLLVVLHAPPEPGEERRRGRFFWRKPDGTWNSTTDVRGPVALESHLEDYDKVLDKLTESEQQAQSSRDYFEVLNHVSPIVRSTRNMHSALQEARQSIPQDRQIIIYRDKAYALERQAELLMTDAKSTLDFTIARQAEAQATSSRQMALSAHRLNLLAAFFFPIATLTAIFGVNLRTGIEDWDNAHSPVIFFLVMAVGLLFGIMLTAFVNRRPPS